MKSPNGWVVIAPILTLACGCASEPEPTESVSVTQAPLVVAVDQFVQEWTQGFWVRDLPFFPGAFVVVFQDSTGPRGVLDNGQNFAIEFGGEFAYECSVDDPVSLNAANLANIPGHFESPGQGLIVQPHDTAVVEFAPCPPQPGAGNKVFWSGVLLDYRPLGAVPFQDAFPQPGDDSNLFPKQMRLSPATPVARSAPLYVGDAASHTFYIRYSNSHPGQPDARIKVGIQDLDAGGATVKAINQVAFPVTPASQGPDQWQIVAVKFNTPPSVQNVYLRLEMKSADIVYLDAAWLSP